MNILVMADSHVGIEIVKWLIYKYIDDITLIVSMSENDIFNLAKKAKLPCFIFKSNNDLIKFLEFHNITIDFGFLVWWPNLVEKSLIKYSKFGFINTHPSLLPYNRGKHPNFWAIVENLPFGVTLHYVDDGIDSGDIIAQKKIDYDWEDTGGSLYYKALECTIDLFKQIYPDIRRFFITHSEQDDKKVTFHLAKEIDSVCKIDLERNYIAKDLLNLLRARTFIGCPACWFEDGNESYEVRIEIKRKNS